MAAYANTNSLNLPGHEQSVPCVLGAPRGTARGARGHGSPLPTMRHSFVQRILSNAGAGAEGDVKILQREGCCLGGTYILVGQAGNRKG